MEDFLEKVSQAIFQTALYIYGQFEMRDFQMALSSGCIPVVCIESGIEHPKVII